MTIPRNLDKIGVLGSVFTALCCLGVPALLTILSAVGRGFLINDVILLPLLVIFLAITVVGLISGMRHHGKPMALILGILSSLIVVGFLFVHFSPDPTRRCVPTQPAAQAQRTDRPRMKATPIHPGKPAAR